MNHLLIECSLCKGKDGFFVIYPSRPYKDANGETKNWNTVRWDSKEMNLKARDWIVSELSKLHPALFQTDRTEPQEDFDNLPF